MRRDPAIEAIREVRKRICREYGNDPKALVAHYMEYQKKLKDRLVSRVPPREQAESG